MTSFDGPPDEAPEDERRSCGCTFEYHMADCPIITDRYLADDPPDDPFDDDYGMDYDFLRDDVDLDGRY